MSHPNRSQHALVLDGGRVFADSPVDVKGIWERWSRLIDFERYVVAVNVIENGEETLKVLSGYHYTTQAAEAAQENLIGAYPTCAVIATVSMLDPADPRHAYANDRYTRRIAGLHGDSVQ